MNLLFRMKLKLKNRMKLKFQNRIKFYVVIVPHHLQVKNLNIMYAHTISMTKILLPAMMMMMVSTKN